MFPLRHKSVVSMRKMQEIQPEVKAIQDRYAKLKTTDPAKQKMNTELMALYRERGVNPASGCVPMLLTMPVLFAFYSLLSQAIELRGAPFVGWITTCRCTTRYYITPLLMGDHDVLAAADDAVDRRDPAQQKMMMFMPVMFTFMFLWAPSGLRHLLVREQPVGDRPAGLHQLPDRAAGAADACGRRPSGA